MFKKKKKIAIICYTLMLLTDVVENKLKIVTIEE